MGREDAFSVYVGESAVQRREFHQSLAAALGAVPLAGIDSTHSDLARQIGRAHV